MTNILDTIVAFKRRQVAKEKIERPALAWEKKSFFKRDTLSLHTRLLEKEQSGIIAEFKRRSPSKGVINEKADVVEVTKAYAQSGAAALSVLTDEEFFGGNKEDLKRARINSIPILQKDFIIDEYQIVVAKAIGADLILLIAACLDPREVRRLAVFARNLGLETLLEIHDEKELDSICQEITLIGINNRDLKTFKVDIDRSLKMASLLPAESVKIAESGIDSVENIIRFRENGFNGFLIGEKFMKAEDPGKEFQSFVTDLSKKNAG